MKPFFFFSKSFLLLFVNKIMFTKCFFSAPKVLFVCKMGAFLLKMCFFPLGRVLFLSAFFFLPMSTTIPMMFKKGCHCHGTRNISIHYPFLNKFVDPQLRTMTISM